MDDGLGKAAGVVLDADGSLAFVELEVTDAVDLADAGHGEKRSSRSGEMPLAIEDVKLSHGGSLAGGSRGADGGERRRGTLDR